MIYNVTDTIVAISTPKGVGGIGVVRLSGEDVLNIAYFLCNKKKISEGVNYVSFFCGKSNLIDKGILLYFKQPKSFTGENVIELHAHGNDIILDSLVYRCIELGARMAERGEFSFRAYLNGKIDLVQAESVNAIINSSAAHANKFILKSLLGFFSNEVRNILERLFLLRVEIEAAIEFPDNIDFVFNTFYVKLLEVYEKYMCFFDNISSSNTFCDFLNVVILGNVNAGKSSLFNCLLNRNRSIVSDIPGTTRDFIDSDLFYNGFKFKLIDTAGFNAFTTDYLEKISIERTLNQIKCANILIFVSDISDTSDSFQKVLTICDANVKVILFKNKIDLYGLTKQIYFHENYVEIFASVKNNDGIDFLISELITTISSLKENFYFVSKRQFDLILRAKRHFNYMISTNENYKSLDFYSENINVIHAILSDLLGIGTSDDVLKHIFSQFCVGK